MLGTFVDFLIIMLDALVNFFGIVVNAFVDLAYVMPYAVGDVSFCVYGRQSQQRLKRDNRGYEQFFHERSP